MRMCVWRSASLVLLAMWVVMVPTTAFAQKDGPTPKYFMLPTQSVRDSVSSIVPERIGELSREQVARDNRIELLPSYADLIKGLGGSTAAIAEAEALYTSGIGLLTAGDDEKAADAFKRAIDMMEQNLGDLTSFDVLADALANLALAYHGAGFDLDARKTMQAYAHLRPNATLDPQKFEAKDLRQTFEDEAAKVKKAGNGVLEIDASSEGIVLIDGVERGKTPLTVRDVGFGHHYLVVRGGAGAAWSEKIRVRGQKKVQKFSADLGDAAVASGGDGGIPSFYVELMSEIESGTFTSAELGAYLKELCAQTGAAYVGFVVMFKEGSKYVAAPFAYGAADGMLVRGDDVEFNLELSNLLVGVSAVSEALVSLAVQRPEDKAVTDVQLGGPPSEVATTTSSTSTAATTTSAEVKEADPIEPPTKVASTSGNTWRYIGITAGGLAVVGLVAGGIYLLADAGGGSASGFTTEVSW